MKVISWSKKLSLGKKQSVKSTTFKKVNLLAPKRIPLRKSVSSVSKFLSSTPLKLLRSNSKSKEVATNESPVLMPLTIRLDSDSSNKLVKIRPRSHTLCDRTELRNILHQRVTQRIMERSMAAVILEAKQELKKEHINVNNNSDVLLQHKLEEDDVYVPFDFQAERLKKESVKTEEDFYMAMS